MGQRVPITLPGYEGECSAYLSFWHKDVGDAVEAGEDLLEYETDKAAVTLEAPVSGTVVEILVDEDEPVQPEMLVAYIETED
jgi:2-oxoglutarate dehydrogenase E2 component (dihydrolipoamide succinyltransferase)